MRERLIELIIQSVSGCARNWAETIADYLIKNNVVVLPCKVGDTVYYIAGNKIYKSKCHAITLQPSLQIHLYDCDGDNARYSTKCIFLNKGEAEKALAERGKSK